MQLDHLSCATPAFPVGGVAHDLLRGQRIFARLDGERFPALIGPAARERHALHDDSDGKPQGRHGFATMMKRDRVAARSYTSHAAGNPRRRQSAKIIGSIRHPTASSAAWPEPFLTPTPAPR